MREMCGVTVGGLYAAQSKVNHSCDYNCQVEGFHFENSLIQVVAARPIQRGCELSASYINPTLDASVRREHLLYSYGFLCECVRCVNQQRFDQSKQLWVASRASSLAIGVGSTAGSSSGSDQMRRTPAGVADKCSPEED